jgi:RNA polymerase sigma-70 factor (ECF subfamily)
VRPRALRIAEDFDGDGMDALQSSTPNPEEAAVASEIRQVVESEIASLPESYRSVLMLREIEGLSTAETADCLGTSEDVVKTRLHRARTMLRDNIYKRAGLAFDGLFTFGQARCDRVVAAVMERIR